MRFSHRSKAPAKTKVDKSQNRRIAKIERELKDDERNLVQTTVSSPMVVAGAVLYLSGTTTVLAAGGVEDREANIINPTFIDIRCKVTSVAPEDGRMGRLILFQDMECQGTAATVLDVLDAATPQAGFNPVNKLNKRHNILWDKSFVTDAQSPIQFFHAKIPKSRLRKIKYIAGTAAIADAGTGAVFLITIVDNIATATGMNGSFSMHFDP